jgi:L-iditol 2-dehydrogenase
MNIPRTMQAVVYRGPNELRVETVPVPEIRPDELLVRVAACGVCPTDIKKIQHGTVPPPRVFGHETAGTIVRVGARVKQFKVGTRVAVHHHVPCLECHACRHRAFSQCATYKLTGVSAGFEPAGGGYAEYVRVMPFVLPGLVRIPAGNTFLEGAMLEPVNTVLKAVNRLNLQKGDSVLVAGQGPIGLMFTRLLALRGMKVMATDLLDSRLALAREFGAVAAVHPKLEVRTPPTKGRPKSRGKEKEPAGEWALGLQHAARGPQGGKRAFDAAVIAVASISVVREAQEQVRGGGQVLLFSHTRRGENAELDLATICMDEKDLIGSYSSDFLLQDEVARLVFSRQLDVRRIITHQFPLEQTPAAIALAARPTFDSLKIVVTQDAGQTKEK